MHTYAIHSESTLADYPDIDFVHFYRDEVKKGFHQRTATIKLHYAYVAPKNIKAWVVLLPGRAEPIEKYAELIFELYQNQYGVFAIDHRGQGLSSRLLPNPNIGYVDNFDDYVDDAYACIEHVLPLIMADMKIDKDLPKYLLCHSMGGAIGALFLRKYEGVFDKAVLSAPMFGINMPLPSFFVRLLCKTIISIRERFKLPKRYFWGHADFFIKPFESNRLTHSKARYNIYMAMMSGSVSQQLGGVSFDWLYHSLNATRKLQGKGLSEQTPTLVLKADKEQIVSNRAIDRVLQISSQVLCVELTNAKHEILFEADTARAHALNAIFEFFEQH